MLRNDVNYSRCGSISELHVITPPYSNDSDEVRLLVYCTDYIQNYAEGIIIISSLPDMNPQRFLEVYLSSATFSNPETGSEIVFGRVDSDLVSAASKILSERQEWTTRMPS